MKRLIAMMLLVSASAMALTPTMTKTSDVTDEIAKQSMTLMEGSSVNLFWYYTNGTTAYDLSGANQVYFKFVTPTYSFVKTVTGIVHSATGGVVKIPFSVTDTATNGTFMWQISIGSNGTEVLKHPWGDLWLVRDATSTNIMPVGTNVNLASYTFINYPWIGADGFSSLANGDITYYNGTYWVNKAIGTSNQFLLNRGGVPVWTNPVNIAGAGSGVITGFSDIYIGNMSVTNIIVGTNGLTADQIAAWNSAVTTNASQDSIIAGLQTSNGTQQTILDSLQTSNGINYTTSQAGSNLAFAANAIAVATTTTNDLQHTTIGTLQTSNTAAYVVLGTLQTSNGVNYTTSQAASNLASAATTTNGSQDSAITSLQTSNGINYVTSQAASNLASAATTTNSYQDSILTSLQTSNGVNYTTAQAASNLAAGLYGETNSWGTGVDYNPTNTGSCYYWSSTLQAGRKVRGIGWRTGPGGTNVVDFVWQDQTNNYDSCNVGYTGLTCVGVWTQVAIDVSIPRTNRIGFRLTNSVGFTTNPCWGEIYYTID